MKTVETIMRKMIEIFFRKQKKQNKGAHNERVAPRNLHPLIYFKVWATNCLFTCHHLAKWHFGPKSAQWEPVSLNSLVELYCCSLSFPLLFLFRQTHMSSASSNVHLWVIYSPANVSIYVHVSVWTGGSPTSDMLLCRPDRAWLTVHHWKANDISVSRMLIGWETRGNMEGIDRGAHWEQENCEKAIKDQTIECTLTVLGTFATLFLTFGYIQLCVL